MSFIIMFASALACAALNAVRGGGQGWLRPVVGLAAGGGFWASGGHVVEALLLAGFLWIWLTQPWGRWYTLGMVDRTVSSGAANWFEAHVEAVADRAFPPDSHSGRSMPADALAWLIGGTVFSLPLAVLSPWWLLLTPLTVWFYTLTLRFAGLGPHVRYGEAAKGALIGLMAVLLAGCAAPRGPDWSGIANGVGQILN